MKIIHKYYQILSLVILLGLSVMGQTLAQQESSLKSIFDLMSFQEVVDINLTFDLEAALEDRKNNEEHPALLSFQGIDGQQQDWGIKIRQRGKFRRMRCTEMPPLKLEFAKSDLKKAGLAKYDDLKLVTYCVEDEKLAKELLLKEYLTYKLYNDLTEASYRVQLVQVHYQDHNSGKSKRQMGFLIEDTAQLRARLDAEKIKEEVILDTNRFNPAYQKKLAMFEYLIGNVDWGLTKSKNVKYLLKDGLIIPVPYDFDFAAIVGAPYVLTTSDYGQTSMRDRVYLGLENNYASLEPSVKELVAMKTKLYQTVNEFKLLKASSKKDMIGYMETYYMDYQHIHFPFDQSAAQAYEE